MKCEISPYDPCIANKEINHKQCAICWYLDNMKILHQDESVVSKFESDLEKMKVVRGKQHIFVGIIVDLSLKGEVIIAMKDYIREYFHDFGNNDGILKHSKTPGKRN